MMDADSAVLIFTVVLPGVTLVGENIAIRNRTEGLDHFFGLL
jgi:hypothetical protein